MTKIYQRERQPDFIIIGVQKCGTTSLYSYLNHHPQVVHPEKKELHFFDLNFHKGVDWYREQFPTFAKYVSPQSEQAIANEGGNFINGFMTGESSPYYIFHPLVPQRIYQLFPQVKLIVLLRDPIARAISHYNHEVRLGAEYLSFEEAIALEEFRLKGETEKILDRETYYSFNHQHYSYLSRGAYIEQLTTWMTLFPREQFLILKSEAFYDNPAVIVNEVFEFLNLPSHKLSKYDKLNAGYYPEMEINEATQRQLEAYFQPYNQKLEEYLGKNFDWG